MELLKIILVVLYTIYMYYRTGVLLKKIIDSNNIKLGTTILYGFILTFAIFETVNIPFILIGKNTTKVVYLIFLMLNLLYVILSYLIKPKIKKYNFIQNVKVIKPKINVETIFYVLTIIIIIFQIINSSMLFKQDADDSFYISWANEAKELDSMYDKYPNTGLEGTSFDYKYLLNTWEMYGGFTARMFNMNTPTLFHTAYQIIYIIISYIAYYLVLKKVLNNKNTSIALFILTIIFLFSGVSVRFKGMFLLGRIYQGKSILLNIIIPFVMYEFLNYPKIQKENYIVLIFTYISAISFNPITIWLLSLVYGIFLLTMLIKRNFKVFGKSLITLLPIIFISAIYILIILTKGTNIKEITSTELFSWTETFKLFMNEGKIIFLMYIISFIIVLIKGNEKQRLISIYFTVLVCLFVINPVLKNVYIKVVTTATYWRLFWLLPIELTIAIATTIIYEKLNYKALKYIFVAFILVLIVFSGKYAYKEELGFTKHQNFMKIQKYIIDEANYILESEEENKKIVTPFEPLHSTLIRQYTSKIILMNSRNMENEKYENYEQMYRQIYFAPEESYNIETIYKMLYECDVNYIILPKTKRLEITDKFNFSVVSENEYDYIIKANERK
ncbi:MAG: hypothetical protein HFJ41_04505 [Clostridia bacterium]|nr:hypothetical protein [Clostridia bacterium]